MFGDRIDVASSSQAATMWFMVSLASEAFSWFRWSDLDVAGQTQLARADVCFALQQYHHFRSFSDALDSTFDHAQD